MLGATMADSKLDVVVFDGHRSFPVSPAKTVREKAEELRWEMQDDLSGSDGMEFFREGLRHAPAHE